MKQSGESAWIQLHRNDVCCWGVRRRSHSHVFLCVPYVKLSTEITECPPLLPAGLFTKVSSVEIASENTAWKLWALLSPAFPTSFVCSICIHTYNAYNNTYQHLLSYIFYLCVYFCHVLLEYVSRRQRLMAITFTTLSPVSRRIPDIQYILNK